MTTDAAGSRPLAHPERSEIRLEGVLHALSDPIRLLIVRQLAGGGSGDGDGDGAGAGLSCSQIELPVTKSTSTHHYRVLRESGVIQQIYRGTAKLNELRRDDLDALFPGLLGSVLGAAAAQAERPVVLS
ncbi:helix-turn-helix domain-containing protein [Streptomyces sp. MZ04]|uniref:ArsR/SmtB family transcription factor n=1 Tax=Streptomyces sp. MZ04 TaxID=2559236 RepID=UPI00107E8FC5|nr:helix-turn-helix domain-containing protein [Streptomyces sp. MZ04]TGA90124.1 transcriptional regulator [Streptomyces sp. MZ04]